MLYMQVLRYFSTCMYLNASTQSLRVESEIGVVIGRNRK